MSENGAAAVETSQSAPGAESAETAAPDYSKSDMELLGAKGDGPVGDAGLILPLPKPAAPSEEAKPDEQQSADAQAKPGAEKPGEQPAQAQPEKVEIDESKIPAEWKPAFKQFPKLRDEVYSGRAMRSALSEAFPGVSPVRAARMAGELLAQVPGGAEQLQQLSQAGESIANLDGILLSEEFEPKVGLVEAVYAQRPETLTDLLIAGANKMWAANIDGFAEVVEHYARELGLLDGRGGGEESEDLPPDPHDERARELDAREQQIEARAEQARQAMAEETENQLVATVAGPYRQEVHAAVSRKMPDAPPDVLKDAIGKVMNTVNFQLAENPVFAAEFLRAKIQGPQAAAQVLMGYAKRMIEPTARRIAERENARLLAWNKSISAKKQAAASRQEPGMGGSPAPENVRVPQGKVNYAQRSDRDLLDGRT
jgi:hypothetical protein